MKRLRNILLGLLLWGAFLGISCLLAKWTGSGWPLVVLGVVFGGAAMVGRVVGMHRRGW